MSEEFEPIVRNHSPELDAILGKSFKTYDKGFVRVVDYMGNEASIVQAARVSYGKGTKKTSEDVGLIRYLIRHRHTTPLEMVHLKLHVKVPMDTWRQWIRHRMSSTNEYSTRYSEAIDDMAVTLPGEWRFQSTTNKQGSGGFLPEHCDCRGTGNIGPTPTPYEPGITCPKCDGTGLDGATLSARERQFHETAKTIYKDRLNAGVAREQARKDLPLSNYTEAYWRIDLHNLLNGFLSLRLDKHAQKEIRDCAAPIHQIVKIWLPNVYEAFEDYDHRRSALLLTRLDTEVVAALNVSASDAIKAAEGFGWLARREDGTLKDIRERIEFEAKAKRLGLNIPWSNSTSSKKVD